MSEKPKVYQGVRVKITVKELLQQRRAHQAASGATLSGGNNVHLSDPVPASPPGLYFEPESVSSTPSYFQPREFSSCVSCEENSSYLDQILDSYLQTETPPDPLLSSMQSAPHGFPDSFQAASSCFYQNLRYQTEFQGGRKLTTENGQGALSHLVPAQLPSEAFPVTISDPLKRKQKIPGLPSDSSTLSGSLDYTYLPAQPPSYAPENYSSPPSLDPRNCGYPSEDYSYPHWPSHAQYDCLSSATTSGCYCAACETERLDAIRASDCFPCPSTDYVNLAPSAAATSDFSLRETNCDICYSS